MPELPEVETVRTGLARHLPGRRLVGATFRRQDLRWPIPTQRIEALVGARCIDVSRRSKYLLIAFDDAPSTQVIVHLGMSGRLFVDVVGAGANAERPPWRLHEHVRLDFGTRLLRLVDPRRFGCVDVTHAGDAHVLLRDLGPEPLSNAFDAAYLHAATRGLRCAIRTFLMDARRVVGVGNIYASEACFEAAVRPRRAAGSLTRRECAAIVDAVQAVLRRAIDAGGTTLRDYVGVDEGAGSFQRELAVYGREGHPCRRCHGVVRRVVAGARSAYYCPRCQR